MTLEELSSQLSTLIDITRQTLEEVRNLEKLLQNLVLDSEEHRCLTKEEHFAPVSVAAKSGRRQAKRLSASIGSTGN